MDLPIIRDIIAHVYLRRLVNRTQPDDIDAQSFDVVELGVDSRQISDPVAVGVLEGCGVDLVDRGLLPPCSLDMIDGWIHFAHLKD